MTDTFPAERGSHLASRTRLLAEWDRPFGSVRCGLGCTLLSAPAGAGKTTLLAAWLARREAPVAWLSLDERDEAAVYLTGFGAEDVYGARPVPPLSELMAVIEKRVLTVRDQLQQVAAGQLARLGVEYLQGAATVMPHGRLVVTTPDGGSTTVAARTVLVATGSRPARLPGIPDPDPDPDPDVDDSDRISAIRTVPDSVVIVGGGAIGVEFATVFTALGVPVTLVSQADRLLPTVDAELVGLLTDDLEAHGIRVLCGVGVAEVGRVGGRLTVTLSDGTRLPTGAVLLAAGRTPNTEGLGLAGAGVERVLGTRRAVRAVR